MFGFSASLLLRLLRPSGNKYLRLHFGEVGGVTGRSEFPFCSFNMAAILCFDAPWAGRVVSRTFFRVSSLSSSLFHFGTWLTTPLSSSTTTLRSFGGCHLPPSSRPKGVEEAGGGEPMIYSRRWPKLRGGGDPLHCTPPLPLLVRKEFSTLYSPSLATSTC